MEQEKYYVSMQSLNISQTKSGNNDEFVIYATEEDVLLLKAKFDNMHHADWASFWRALVPIVPYHLDQPNADYDSEMVEAFQLLYDLGDEQTRSHIGSMGILGDRKL